jgi:hypothetical protein
MMFPVPEGFCDGLPIQADPLYRLRAGLIIGGLAASVLSVMICLRELSRKSNQVLESAHRLPYRFDLLRIGSKFNLDYQCRWHSPKALKSL